MPQPEEKIAPHYVESAPLPPGDMPRPNIVIDLETLGKLPGYAIISIGAVAMGANGENTPHMFSSSITVQSCLDAGLKIDDDTCAWHFKQDPACLKAWLDGNPRHLKEVLQEFSAWVELQCLNYDDRRLWGNDPSFDNAFLALAYAAVGLENPFPFWGHRCVRTAKDGVPEKLMPKFEGVKHIAIVDAVNESHIVQAYLQRMKRLADVDLEVTDGE